MEKTLAAIKEVGFPIVIALILLYAILCSIPELKTEVELLKVQFVEFNHRLETIEETIDGHFTGEK